MDTQPACTCGAPLLRFIRDTRVPGEEATDFVVRFKIDPSYEDFEQRQETFEKEGFWAACVWDAEAFTGRSKRPAGHNILSANGEITLFAGQHPVLA